MADTELVEFPDAERVVIDYLAAQVGVPVRLTVPKPRPSAFVIVQRVGGPRLSLVADNAMFVVEAWASGPSAAKTVLGVARSHLLAMRGQVVAGVPVYRVQEVSGPAFLPDPSSTQSRYTLTVQIAMRGVSAVDIDTITGHRATTTSSAAAGLLYSVVIAGALATATTTAPAGSMVSAGVVAGSKATTTSTAFAGVLVSHAVIGSLATSSSSAAGGALVSQAVVGSLATVTSSAFVGGLVSASDIAGSQATSTSSAFAGALASSFSSFQLEGSTDRYLLEDATGVYLLEA